MAQDTSPSARSLSAGIDDHMAVFVLSTLLAEPDVSPDRADERFNLRRSYFRVVNALVAEGVLAQLPWKGKKIITHAATVSPADLARRLAATVARIEAVEGSAA